MTVSAPIRTLESALDPWPVQALAAVLECSAESPLKLLPAQWQWLYFLDCAPQSTLGLDGHPAVSDLMPTLSQPRRMFAGGRVEYHYPLQVGQSASMRESVLSRTAKTGSRGAMTLVTVANEYVQADRLCLREERDFIYLQAGPASTPDTSIGQVPEADWAREICPDEAMLFRFSALTFNSHRIHYDRSYAQEVEAYPDLLVQGPLNLLLLLELLRAHSDRPIASLSYRIRRPLYVGRSIQLRAWEHDQGASLKSYDDSGQLSMDVTITYREIS